LHATSGEVIRRAEDIRHRRRSRPAEWLYVYYTVAGTRTGIPKRLSCNAEMPWPPRAGLRDLTRRRLGASPHFHPDGRGQVVSVRMAA
jgi:hypothetical protein